ncbi:hem peroxidase [Amanita muscaria]
MSANDRPSTLPQDPASKNMPEPAGIYGFFQTTLQTVRGKFGGASEALTSLPISLTNSANPFVKFSESTSIDLAKNELSKILEEYACQPARSKNIKDKGKMNKAMIKLFNKPIDNQSPDETTYFQSVRTSVEGKNYPEAATVFENILSGETPRDRPNGITSLAFAFTSILSLSLNRGDPNQASLNRNSTSPYFDLSPLYGSNDRETDAVRTKDGSGMLWPDCFFEDRLATLPDAAPALLILWNRFHNHTAKYLLWHNEKDKNGNDKWIDPSELEEGSQELLSQDDRIFNIARSITCINFMNIVKEDILKGFFGLPFVGPSVEVDVLHDVRGLMDETRKGHCSTMEAYFLYDFTSFTPPSIADKPFDTASVADRDLRRRNYIGLNRTRHGYFDDGDLASALFDAIETSAGTPGARSISKRDRERVIRKIKQGQKWNVCTLNEFRVSLGLKRLQSFSEWNPNPAVAGAAEELYENIDNLELYPGLLAEEPTADSGFGFGRTMTWGLIADIVTRIRSDPRFTAKFKEEELTKWGYHDCMATATLSKGPFNALMPKLLHRTLPHNFPYKNAYSLYPFTVPTPESKARIEAFINQAEKYDLDFSRPKKKVKVLRTIEAISKVFNDPVKFPSPCNQNFRELTGGYGNMLGFDDLALHDRDLMLTLFALFPDKGAAKRIGATFGEKAQEYLRDRCTLLSGNARARIDIVEDMIDATCVSWVCETIYDRDLHPNEKERKRLGDEGTKKYTKEKEIEAREDFAACYAYIFRNGEPEIGLKVRERALSASKALEDHLVKKLRELTRDKGDRHFGEYLANFSQWLKAFMGQLWQEYSTTGKILSKTSAQTFLDRIMKAADLKPLKHLVDRTPHLLELKKKYQQGNAKESDQDARALLEKQRVVANVIALSVVISVHFAKVCAQAVDFYLDEKYSLESERLVELCNSQKSTNDEIMAYIREAQRIGQQFGLWRDVSLSSTEPQVVIQQGHGHPDVIIEQGDRVFADFSFAHNDPEQFEEPRKVKPGRKIKSLQGLGVHKCPAGAFIDETMAEMFRVIFSQKNLARARENGLLRTTTLHPNPAPRYFWTTT